MGEDPEEPVGPDSGDVTRPQTRQMERPATGFVLQDGGLSLDGFAKSKTFTSEVPEAEAARQLPALPCSSLQPLGPHRALPRERHLHSCLADERSAKQLHANHGTSRKHHVKKRRVRKCHPGNEACHTRLPSVTPQVNQAAGTGYLKSGSWPEFAPAPVCKGGQAKFCGASQKRRALQVAGRNQWKR